MKIFGWLADLDGVGYYRLCLPGAALANRGHAVWLDGAMPEEIRHGDEVPDVIVGQRVCEPSPSATWQRFARAGQIKMVYEIDDDLFSIDPSNRSAWAFYEKGVSHDEGRPFFDDNRRARIIENIRVADVVTVSTAPLAEIVSQWNSNVVVLPNQVPGWLLGHERPVTSDRVTIGWRGGSSHSRDFGELAAPLKRFLNHPANRDRVEFHSMGADYGPRVAGRFGSTRHTGWVDGVDSFLRLIDFDLGVIPLRPSTFNRSKSDLALLELSALGIPSIVSGDGPYGRARADGAPCSVALRNEGDWRDHLTELVNVPETRVQLGKSAREWAATRTIEGNAHLWEQAYGA